MLLQLTFFSQVELFHVSPDVLPALVVCLGLLGGSLTGAVSGFAIGFLLDCLLIQPLGGASLVLIAVGFAAGIFRERFEIHSRLVAPLLCAVLTLVAELGFGAVEAMFGIDTDVSVFVVRDMLIKSVFAFFLGWAIYAGLRRLVRPGAGRRGDGAAHPPTDRAGSVGHVPATRGPGASRAAWRCGSPSSAASRWSLFAILFFRLWTLQILEGAENLAQAKNNRTRSIKIIAPRGKILARNGEVLVDNRTSLALQVDTSKLPEEAGRTDRRAEGNRRTRPHETAAGPEAVIEEEEEVVARARRSRCAATSATTSSTTSKNTRGSSPA